MLNRLGDERRRDICIVCIVDCVLCTFNVERLGRSVEQCAKLGVRAISLKLR